MSSRDKAMPFGAEDVKKMEESFKKTVAAIDLRVQVAMKCLNEATDIYNSLLDDRNRIITQLEDFNALCQKPP